MANNLEGFLAEVKRLPTVVNATCSSEIVVNVNSTSWGHDWEGKVEGLEEVEFTGLNVGFDFFETMGIDVISGRLFSPLFGKEETTVLLNEAAVAAMAITDPIGKWIQLFNVRREIVGVAKDFHFRPLREKIKPIFIVCNPRFTKEIAVRVKQGAEREAINGLEKLYKKYNAGVPFEASFLDDKYDALYATEVQVGRLSKYFATTAILISCLGLFGLAMFTAERRMREISIRKVMGCSEWRIVQLLSLDFTLMVLISVTIALPVAYWLAKGWLSGFAYHVDLGWWYFAGAGLAALCISWITVGVQTVRAARANPVVSLRSE
jgi:ABC-type antimicrobial peptide transport system permease subunit